MKPGDSFSLNCSFDLFDSHFDVRDIKKSQSAFTFDFHGSYYLLMLFDHYAILYERFYGNMIELYYSAISAEDIGNVMDISSSEALALSSFISFLLSLANTREVIS